MPKRNPGRVVFSTDRSHERACPRCGADPCKCETVTSVRPGDQSPRVRRETKGRGGKTVTIVTELTLSDVDLQTLAKTLKQLCATGGTVKNGTIEIQGDHRDKIVAKLQSLGYKAKSAGG
jgi:translation initiation factor 1